MNLEHRNYTRICMCNIVSFKRLCFLRSFFFRFIPFVTSQPDPLHVRLFHGQHQKSRSSFCSYVHLIAHPHRRWPYDARDTVQYHIDMYLFSSLSFIHSKRKMNRFTKHTKSLHFILSSTSFCSIQTQTHTHIHAPIKRSDPPIQLVCMRREARRRRKNEDLTWLGISFLLYSV